MTFADSLQISRHPKAPEFNDLKEARKLMLQIYNEATSPNFNPNNEARDLIRQFAMVNLWFMVKVVCGYSGPYNKINEDLHLDMANWRQSDACMERGARGAGFIFRGGYKSTIWGHGSIPWEVVRNPNISIRYSSSRIDKAETFVACAKDVFTGNDFFAWLFPEFVISRSKGGFTTPARTRTQASPTVKPGSTGGASAGDHHNLHIGDDLIDEQDLNAENMSTIEMERKIEWFKKTEVPLLISPTEDRYLLFGTRYAIDDLYSIPWDNCRKLEGYTNVDCDLNPKNKWSIYYRKVIEDGVEVLPELLSEAFMEEMMERDPWTAMTQYFNDPHESGLTEFSQVEVPKCEVYLTPDQPYIRLPNGDIRYFRDMNIALALDPAFTYRGVSAKTSRTGIVVGAKDHKDKVYLLDVRAGYFKIDKTFDIIFELIQKFKGHIRCVLIESNAQQKILEDLLIEERKKRGIHISIRPEAATTDKDARIRSTLGSYLAREALFIGKGHSIDFMDELRSFPMAKYKKDVLDASEKVISFLRKPGDPDERAYAEVERLRRQTYEYDNYTGY